ncbi:MAG: hypothetical protein ABFS18_14230 [Thermodesulfobacteriota bacterium]
MKSAKTICCAFMFMLVTMLTITSLCSAETTMDKTSMAEVEQEAKDFIKALKSYTAGQRAEALQRTATALENLDKRIEALETRIDQDWDKMDQAAREKARAGLKALHKQRNQVAEKYGSLKSSSTEAWEHVKRGFSDAYKALHEGWEKSEEEFGADK